MKNKILKKTFLAAIVLMAAFSVAPATKNMQDIAVVEAATIGEQNALSQAKNYLSTMAFSKKGLKKQLMFEGYSKEEASYAVKNCGANWKQQAYKKGKTYLDTMSFSRQGLIDQLKFDGFSAKQAEYAAKKLGY